MKPGHRRGVCWRRPWAPSRSEPVPSPPRWWRVRTRPRRPCRGRSRCPRGCRTSPPTPRAWGRRRPIRSSTSTSTLAGRDPAGLAQAVAAVSTPGSPDYRHYLTSAQYAAAFGPTAAEVAQVSSALRAEGLTVGTPDPGSILLPVRGTAAAVSAAFGTPLESVQAPHQAPAIVNTASPQVPASLAGAVTAVVGLDGLFHEHAMVRPKSGPSAPGAGRHPQRRRTPGAGNPGRERSAGPRHRRPLLHPAGLPGGAGQRLRGHLHVHADVLDLRAGPAVRPGPHRAGPDDRHRGVRAVLAHRLQRIRVLLRPFQPHPQRGRRRGAGRAAGRPGGGRARHGARVLQRAGRLPRGLRDAERQRRPGARHVQPHCRRRHRPGRHHQLGQLRSRDRRRDPPGGEHDLLPHGPAGADDDRGLG